MSVPRNRHEMDLETASGPIFHPHLPILGSCNREVYILYRVRVLRYAILIFEHIGGLFRVIEVRVVELPLLFSRLPLLYTIVKKLGQCILVEKKMTLSSGD